MIQIFFSATQYAAATVTAAIRAGLFGPREDHRRILVVSNTAAIPEVGTPLDRMAGFEKLRPEFDEVRSWNEFISPHHPAGWSPRAQDAIMWEKAVRLAWDLGDEPVEIACESIQANPSRAVAEIFADSPIHVYADGLMSYGPTRNRVPHGMSSRIARVLHLDLIPGLRPLLLAEYGVEPVPIPNEPIVGVLNEIGEQGADILAARIPAENPRRPCSSASTCPPSTSSPRRKRRSCTSGCSGRRQRPVTRPSCSSRTRAPRRRTPRPSSPPPRNSACT